MKRTPANDKSTIQTEYAQMNDSSLSMLPDIHKKRNQVEPELTHKPSNSADGKDEDTSADGDIRHLKEDLISSLSKRPDPISKGAPSVFHLEDSDAHKQAYLSKMARQVTLETEQVHQC